MEIHHQSGAHITYIPQPFLSLAAYAASDYERIHAQMIALYKGKPSYNIDTQYKYADLQEQFHLHAETKHPLDKRQHTVDIYNVDTSMVTKLYALI
uniref:Uncharacterized protein n=1 Tax=Candidatus Kentrum sp. TUN TaxID=2126343 RepID=A0A450Z8S2_9GAMM|nr:MAG: hypothetical protein BECKTUN1418E_GA0071001_100135 [Candidatus Kentron sp. TUN]VFK51237.1 MAG: hypothetical protein BECKTUN1418F_GA0071002_100135 [Candidatus Kentron sp. TUN]